MGLLSAMAWAGVAGVGSGLFAIAASGLWFWSAAIKLPPQTVTHVNQDGSLTRPPRETVMEHLSRISTWAALRAGVAALLQSRMPSGRDKLVGDRIIARISVASGSSGIPIGRPSPLAHRAKAARRTATS